MANDKTSEAGGKNYSLQASAAGAELDLPELPYLPLRPRGYQPVIGVIGCGGISAEHLKAYAGAGYRVAALVDREPARAKERRDEFAPEAEVCVDSDELLSRSEIDVVDVIVHPEARAGLVRDALSADKHVLSQKPFVTDLEVGEQLCDLADERGRLLAVNQNGRWAPWVSWMREAIGRGLIGEVAAVDTLMSWDHSWVEGTPFDEVPHLVLYDFAIHWFDMLHCYARGQRAEEVYATTARFPGQTAKPPLFAQASIRLERSQASLAFRGAGEWGPLNHTYITGSEGVLRSTGEDLEKQRVELQTSAGRGSPDLQGSWFPGGFDGAMSELIVAIEEGRQPSNSGRDNLASLEICFAAVASADRGQPVRVGEVRRLD